MPRALLLRSSCILGLGVIAVASRPALAEVSIDPTVTSVVFDAGTQTRAIAGDRQGAYLIIERLTQRGGQIGITELPLSGANVPMSEFKNLSLRSLKGTSLMFDIAPRRSGARADIQCSAQLAFGKGRVGIQQLSCTQGGQPYSPAPQPAPAPPPPGDDASMEDIKRATEACNDFAWATSDRKKCLDSTLALMKTRFKKSAIATLKACVDGFWATSSRQWCLDAVARSKREPPELIRYCTEQHWSESDRKECITKFAGN
jgi:hypothetical protein